MTRKSKGYRYHCVKLYTFKMKNQTDPQIIPKEMRKLYVADKVFRLIKDDQSKDL